MKSKSAKKKKKNDTLHGGLIRLAQIEYKMSAKKTVPLPNPRDVCVLINLPTYPELSFPEAYQCLAL